MKPPKQRTISSKHAFELWLSDSPVVLTAKTNNHGPQGRPLVIAKVRDVRIKPEVVRLKQHQENFM